MYFPIGWPKVVKLNNPEKCAVRQVVCNRDKIFFTILTDDSLFIYYCKPCLLLVFNKRLKDSINQYGLNEHLEWRPDSSSLVVVTSGGFLLLYKIAYDLSGKSVYEQVDPPQAKLRRDSAELFLHQAIPSISLTLDKCVYVGSKVTGISCIRDELMVATSQSNTLRYKWDLSLNRDYCVNLNRIPFCLNQQSSKAEPIFEKDTYIVDMHYSPLIGGFSIVFNDGRAAFLTAYSLQFDPNQMQGIWAPEINDATCSSVNHKFRLITFGRRNSECIVYHVDETTGGLAVSHRLIIPSQIFPGPIGSVSCMRWSPDARALAVAWQSGGFSLWSTFGALLTCSLSWDYGLNVDLALSNPLVLRDLEWSAEGYQLFMVKQSTLSNNVDSDLVFQLSFVKSALTVNPCVSHQNHLYLQGEDRLYVNLGSSLSQIWNPISKSNSYGRDSPLAFSSALVDSKQWVVVPIPSSYSASNWPIRYTAINTSGDKLAVAGRSGLAHYSLSSHKWKLFGNETQEKDMLVTGGLLWWKDYVVSPCYNILLQKDELRFYPSNLRLSNAHMTSLELPSQVLLLDSSDDQVLIFCADGYVTIYSLAEKHKEDTGGNVDLKCIQVIDMSALSVHPACFIAFTLTSLRIEPLQNESLQKSNFVINVSGRLLMVNQQDENDQSQILQATTVIASSVENVWSPEKLCRNKPHLTEAMWLYCGAQGMRVWLPLFPRIGVSTHTFMSKRIMLSFQLKIYPLAILYEDAILLGAGNDSVLFIADSHSPFSLPFCVVDRTNEVYLHHILRLLIRRNLGFQAWEIAKCCTSLPYFRHSLELLLHEVLEEEATSKEPIPDAQLPSVIEFIQEFPDFLETVVQCARKTEMTLWPILFSAAGKPAQLFQRCLIESKLETAASYLIILQNLESSSVSHQYATRLLDSALNSSNWELSKDLVRFLKTIDPNDVEHSKTKSLLPPRVPQTPPVNEKEDLSLVLGTMPVTRDRSMSSTTNPAHSLQSKASLTEASSAKRKKSVPVVKSDSSVSDLPKSAEEFFMDVVIERHARRLLSQHRLRDLGSMAASLDFPLVRWLARERNRAAIVDYCVSALKDLHADFSWPFPAVSPNSPLLSLENTNSMDIFEPASNFGDSGYMSISHRLSDQTSIHQRYDEKSVNTETVSWAGSEDFDGERYRHLSAVYNDIPSPQVLDHLSKQITTKGSQKSEIQLRYFLQLLIDAGCLQWALLISILLRDAMAVYRIVNAARSLDQTFEAVERLKENLISLIQWSCTDCIGYKPFMAIIQNQVATLNSILATKFRIPMAMPEIKHAPLNIPNSIEKSVHQKAESRQTVDEAQVMRNSDSPTPSITVQLSEQFSCVVM